MTADSIELERVYRRTPGTVVWTFLLKNARYWLAVLRFLTPVFKVPFLVPGSSGDRSLPRWLTILTLPVRWIVDRRRFVIVTRFDYVQEVLTRDHDFPVPFGAKGAELGWKPPFLLGMQPGPDYNRTERHTHQFFRPFEPDDEAAATSPEASPATSPEASPATSPEASPATSPETSPATTPETPPATSPATPPDAAAETRPATAPAMCPASTLGLIEALSWRFANQQLDMDGGEIDAIKRLVGRVPTLVVERYYGIHTIENRRLFEDCHIVISGYFFGYPHPKTKKLPFAQTAAEIVKATYRQAIEQARGDPAKPDHVLNRMLAYTSEQGEPLGDDRILSYLWGMTLGFLPTCLMANGNILEVLLENPEMLRAATDAARAGDDERLERCLFEAMRFRPLNPGPWRLCSRDATVGEDTRRPKKITRDSYITASTQSAMFDARRVVDPGRFDPDRSPRDYMLFGYGIHDCIGQAMAEIEITQTMKALLRRDPRPAPNAHFERVGYFPREMWVRYEPEVPW